MKTKKADTKNVCLVILIVLVILLLFLSWKVYESGTPVKLKSVLDSETVILTNGKTVELLGMSTEAGDSDNKMVKRYLETLLDSRNIWLEYKDGKALLWVGCEDSPKFLIFRKEGENPIGCKMGVLVNDQIMKIGWLKSI